MPLNNPSPDTMDDQQIVWDPFNRYTDPLREFDAERPHWSFSEFMTRIEGDTANPYGGVTLRLAASIEPRGKRIYLDEIPAIVGETVTFTVHLKVPATTTYRVNVYVRSPTVLLTTTSSVTFTGTGAAETRTTAVVTIPAGAEGGSVFIGVLHITGTDPIDVYAMWGVCSNGRRLASGNSALSPLIAELDNGRQNQTTVGNAIALASALRHSLRDTQAQLAKIDAGSVTDHLRICLITDSWGIDDVNAQATKIPTALRAMLQTRYGVLSTGYISAAWSYTTAFTRAVLGGWTSSDALPASLGPDVAHVTSTDIATPASMTFGNPVALPATGATILYYRQVGGGSFRYQVDAGAWTTVNTDGAAGVQVVTITGLTAAAHTVKVEVTIAGSSAVTLLGVSFERSTQGVVIHNIANSGISTVDLVEVAAASWQAGITALAPNLCIILIGTNDHTANLDPVTFTANLTTVITRIRVAMPRCDVLLVSPPTNGVTQTYTMRNYADAMYGVATAQQCAFVDANAHFEAYTNENTRGMWFDTRHLTTAGGRRLAALIVREIQSY